MNIAEKRVRHWISLHKAIKGLRYERTLAECRMTSVAADPVEEVIEKLSGELAKSITDYIDETVGGTDEDLEI